VAAGRDGGWLAAAQNKQSGTDAPKLKRSLALKAPVPGHVLGSGDQGSQAKSKHSASPSYAVTDHTVASSLVRSSVENIMSTGDRSIAKFRNTVKGPVAKKMVTTQDEGAALYAGDVDVSDVNHNRHIVEGSLSRTEMIKLGKKAHLGSPVGAAAITQLQSNRKSLETNNLKLAGLSQKDKSDFAKDKMMKMHLRLVDIKRGKGSQGRAAEDIKAQGKYAQQDHFRRLDYQDKVRDILKEIKSFHLLDPGTVALLEQRNENGLLSEDAFTLLYHGVHGTINEINRVETMYTSNSEQMLEIGLRVDDLIKTVRLILKEDLPAFKGASHDNFAESESRYAEFNFPMMSPKRNNNNGNTERWRVDSPMDVHDDNEGAYSLQNGGGTPDIYDEGLIVDAYEDPERVGMWLNRKSLVTDTDDFREAMGDALVAHRESRKRHKVTKNIKADFSYYMKFCNVLVRVAECKRTFKASARQNKKEIAKLFCDAQAALRPFCNAVYLYMSWYEKSFADPCKWTEDMMDEDTIVPPHIIDNMDLARAKECAAEMPSWDCEEDYNEASAICPRTGGNKWADKNALKTEKPTETKTEKSAVRINFLSLLSSLRTVTKNDGEENPSKGKTKNKPRLHRRKTIEIKDELRDELIASFPGSDAALDRILDADEEIDALDKARKTKEQRKNSKARTLVEGERSNQKFASANKVTKQSLQKFKPDIANSAGVFEMFRKALQKAFIIPKTTTLKFDTRPQAGMNARSADSKDLLYDKYYRRNKKHEAEINHKERMLVRELRRYGLAELSMIGQLKKRILKDRLSEQAYSLLRASTDRVYAAMDYAERLPSRGKQLVHVGLAVDQLQDLLSEILQYDHISTKQHVATYRFKLADPLSLNHNVNTERWRINGPLDIHDTIHTDDSGYSINSMSQHDIYIEGDSIDPLQDPARAKSYGGGKFLHRTRGTPFVESVGGALDMLRRKKGLEGVLERTKRSVRTYRALCKKSERIQLCKDSQKRSEDDRQEYCDLRRFLNPLCAAVLEYDATDKQSESKYALESELCFEGSLSDPAYCESTYEEEPERVPNICGNLPPEVPRTVPPQCKSQTEINKALNIDEVNNNAENSLQIATNIRYNPDIVGTTGRILESKTYTETKTSFDDWLLKVASNDRHNVFEGWEADNYRAFKLNKQIDCLFGHGYARPLQGIYMKFSPVIDARKTIAEYIRQAGLKRDTKWKRDPNDKTGKRKEVKLMTYQAGLWCTVKDSSRIANRMDDGTITDRLREPRGPGHVKKGVEWDKKLVSEGDIDANERKKRQANLGKKRKVRAAMVHDDWNAVGIKRTKEEEDLVNSLDTIRDNQKDKDKFDALRKTHLVDDFWEKYIHEHEPEMGKNHADANMAFYGALKENHVTIVNSDRHDHDDFFQAIAQQYLGTKTGQDRIRKAICSYLRGTRDKKEWQNTACDFHGGIFDYLDLMVDKGDGRKVIMEATEELFDAPIMLYSAEVFKDGNTAYKWNKDLMGGFIAPSDQYPLYENKGDEFSTSSGKRFRIAKVYTDDDKDKITEKPEQYDSIIPREMMKISFHGYFDANGGLEGVTSLILNHRTSTDKKKNEVFSLKKENALTYITKNIQHRG
jgi:hypothetical protein